jgi:hypothetical protein
VATRDIETILAEAGVADPPTAARLARLSGGRPGIARVWALAPEAVTARAEIARSLLDIAGEGPARRLSVGRELVGRAAELVRALDRAAEPPSDAASALQTKRSRKGSRPTAAPVTDAAETKAADAPSDGTAEPDAAPDDAAVRDTRAPASERRRAAAQIVEIWRDLTRDLVLVGLGEERRLRDPAMLDDLRASTELTATQLGPFLARLDRTAELIDANVSPELALDVLLLAWPRRAAAA